MLLLASSIRCVDHILMPSHSFGLLEGLVKIVIVDFMHSLVRVEADLEGGWSNIADSKWSHVLVCVDVGRLGDIESL